MNPHVEFALAHPVFDPERDMAAGGFHWLEQPNVSVGLTVNIGME